MRSVERIFSVLSSMSVIGLPVAHGWNANSPSEPKGNPPSPAKRAHELIHLQHFKVETINVASYPICLILGPKRVGKSTLAKNLIERFTLFNHVIVVDPFGASPLEIGVHRDVSTALGSLNGMGLGVSKLIVLDSDKAENESAGVDFIYESGHRSSTALIQTLQYPDLKERRRANIDFCFISSHITDGSISKKTYQHVAHVIPKFSQFEEIMKRLAATPYTFLVVDNTATGPWQGKLAYYKCT